MEPSWSFRWAVSVASWPPGDRLGPSCGRLGGPWVVLGRFRGLGSRRRPSASRKREKVKSIEHQNGESTSSASRGLLEGFLGASSAVEAASEGVLGHLRRLGARVGCLEPLMGRLGGFWRPLGQTSRLLGPEQVTRVAATSPRGTARRPGRCENFGSGLLHVSSGRTTEAQGMGQRTGGHAHAVPRGTVAARIWKQLIFFAPTVVEGFGSFLLGLAFC